MTTEVLTPSVPDLATVPRVEDEVLASIMAQLRAPERPDTGALRGPVLAYERVSTHQQVSIPDQKRAIDEDASHYGLMVDRHRCDEGSRWDNKRPDYRALHADIESGDYRILWLHNADRLGGDDLEFVATIRKAHQRGMMVRDCVHGDISPEMASILGLVSYFEIRNGHYRAVLKLHGKHLEGKKLGAVPPGYAPQCRLHPCRCGRHGKHVRAEPLATLVVQLFQRCRDGESLESLRRWWNAETGQRRDHGGILGILRNPYYVGIIINCRYRNGKLEGRGKREEWEHKMGTHDNPLIDPSTFAVVQARLRTQENVGQHRQGGPSHPLVGLLHCVACQRRLQRTRQYGGGTTYRWECPLCKAGRAERRIERSLHDVLAAIPVPEDRAVEDHSREHERMQRALRQEIAAIDAECDKWNRRMTVWEDDRADGTMDKDRYRGRMDEARAALDELRQQRASLEDSRVAQPGRAVLLEEVRAKLKTLADWTTVIPCMTDEERRDMYRCMIKALRLDLAAGIMTVEYTEALARWYGRPSDVVPLPSQKKGS